MILIWEKRLFILNKIERTTPITQGLLKAGAFCEFKNRSREGSFQMCEINNL